MKQRENRKVRHLSSRILVATVLLSTLSASPANFPGQTFCYLNHLVLHGGQMGQSPKQATYWDFYTSRPSPGFTALFCKKHKTSELQLDGECLFFNECNKELRLETQYMHSYFLNKVYLIKDGLL